jgi:hypothetical protein
MGHKLQENRPQPFHSFLSIHKSLHKIKEDRKMDRLY